MNQYNIGFIHGQQHRQQNLMPSYKWNKTPNLDPVLVYVDVLGTERVLSKQDQEYALGYIAGYKGESHGYRGV